MSFVIDASVAMKWFIQEPLREEARRVGQSSDPLHAPDLLFAEVANIGWKLVRRNEISRDQAFAMTAMLGARFAKIFPSSLLNERGLEIALSLDHAVYDCLYVACAEMTGGILITADSQLCKAIEGTTFAPLVRHLQGFQS